jgi:hypothetical protein
MSAADARSLVLARDRARDLVLAIDLARLDTCGRGLPDDLHRALTAARALADDLDRADEPDRALVAARALADDLDRADDLGGADARALVAARQVVAALDLNRARDLPASAPGHRFGNRRSPAARRLLAAAARMLPAGDRARYAEEFGSELAEIALAGGGRRVQLAYAARQVMSVVRLRAALASPRRRRAAP